MKGEGQGWKLHTDEWWWVIFKNEANTFGPFSPLNLLTSSSIETVQQPHFPLLRSCWRHVSGSPIALVAWPSARVSMAVVDHWPINFQWVQLAMGSLWFTDSPVVSNAFWEITKLTDLVTWSQMLRDHKFAFDGILNLMTLVIGIVALSVQDSLRRTSQGSEWLQNGPRIPGLVSVSQGTSLSTVEGASFCFSILLSRNART